MSRKMSGEDIGASILLLIASLILGGALAFGITALISDSLLKSIGAGLVAGAGSPVITLILLLKYRPWEK